jgi:hypothetical protein
VSSFLCYFTRLAAVSEGGRVRAHNIQHETPPQTTLQVYDTAVRAR